MMMSTAMQLHRLPPTQRARAQRTPLGLATLLMLTTASHAASAATCTATGNGSWLQPASWSGCAGSVPGATDTARINAGSTITIPSGDTVTVAAIEFGETGFTYGLTVDGTLTVGNLAHRGASVITGLGAITVTGTYDWTGTGALDGVLRPDGSAPPLTFTPGSVWNLSSTTLPLRRRAIVQQGAANFSAGNLGCSNTVSWLIAAGATLTLSHEGGIGSGGVNCLIRNEGTIRKTGAGTTFRLTDSRVRLENHGLIEVLAGTFSFEGSGGPTEHSGIFRTDAGATLVPPSATANFNAGTRFEGAGTVQFTSTFGPRTFNASVEFAGPVRIAGAVGGTELVASAGVELVFQAGLEWQQGLLYGPGRFRVPSARTLILSGAQPKTLTAGAQLVLEGSTLWQGGQLTLAASSAPPETRLLNAAGADFQVLFRPATIALGSSNNNSVIENAGTFTATASASAGLLTLGASGRGAVLNRGTMTLAGAVRSETHSWRQTAGQLLLDAATLTLTAQSFNRPLQLEGGVVSGTAMLDGAVHNSGAALLPGGADALGEIGIIGRYQQDSDGILQLDVAGAAPDAHDALVVTGTPGSASLGGSLSLQQLGGFQFSPGVSLPVLIASSRGGEFTVLDIDPGFAPAPQVFLLANGVRVGLDAGLFANGFEAQP